MLYERDEYSQDLPEYTPEVASVGNPWQQRKTKGNRKAQAARYYLKNKAKRRRYMRAYMAKRRSHPVNI